MTRIQDIRLFEEQICDAIAEYIPDMEYYEHPLMAIYREDGELQVVIDEPENLQLPEGAETYEIERVISPVDEDDPTLEPDYDAISEIANDWLYIEH